MLEEHTVVASRCCGFFISVDFLMIEFAQQLNMAPGDDHRS